MFTPEPSIQYVPVSREQVVAIIEAINQPQVNIPGKVPQAVTGLLCSVRNANGSYSIVVALHLSKTGENVVYLHPKRQLSAEEYRAVQDEGVHFLESMGFMLDNTNYRNLSPEQQDAALKRLAVFSPPRGPDAAAGGGERAAASEALRLARLLASF